jgi:hypothetical protein
MMVDILICFLLLEEMLSNFPIHYNIGSEFFVCSFYYVAALSFFLSFFLDFLSFLLLFWMGVHCSSYKVLTVYPIYHT